MLPVRITHEQPPTDAGFEPLLRMQCDLGGQSRVPGQVAQFLLQHEWKQEEPGCSWVELLAGFKLWGGDLYQLVPKH
eukprot:2549438-Alexandrium_andersonii.AAC.1